LQGCPVSKTVRKKQDLTPPTKWWAAAAFRSVGRGRDVSTHLYMVIERFKDGDAVRVYRRFRDRGRLAPEGLAYVSSWVDTKLERCYQLMETDDPRLLDEWIAQWSDIVDFEVFPVITSAQAAERIAPRM
jgi:hypothetical protein